MQNIKLKRVVIKKLFGNLNYDLDFENESGVSIIIGKNGCGKTTLLNLIDFCLSPSYERYEKAKSIPFEDVVCTLNDGSTIELYKKDGLPVFTINGDKNISFEQVEECRYEYSIKELICDEVNHRMFSGFNRDEAVEDIKKEYGEHLSQLLKEGLLKNLEDNKEIHDELCKYIEKDSWEDADLRALKEFIKREDVASIEAVRRLEQPVLKCLNKWIGLNKCIARNEIGELFEMGALNFAMREPFVKDKMKHWGNRHIKDALKDYQIFYVDNFLETGRIDASVNFGGKYSAKSKTDLDEIIDDSRLCKNLLEDIYWKHLRFCSYEQIPLNSDANSFCDKYIDAMAILFRDDSYLTLKDHKPFLNSIEYYDVWIELENKFSQSCDNYKEKAKLQEILNSRQESSKKTYDLVQMILANGEKLEISKLSSGEKQNYYVFASLLIRPFSRKLLHLLKNKLDFLNRNLELNGPLRDMTSYDASVPSIFLIDEPEISWHIEWQEDFVNLVKEICKMNDIQVIMTTHSPHILMDHTDCLVSLNNDDEA